MTYHKKIFFIFQCSPLITQYTSPTFVATTLSLWKNKSFDCSSNRVVTASLTSLSLENHLPRRKFGLRISVIYPSLVSCHQTLKKMFRVLGEQLQVLLTALATSVLLKRTQHSWDPSCTDLGHVQLFMNNGPNCSCCDACLFH